MQLISVQKQLKQDDSVESSLVQLNQLNELRGEKPKGVSSSSSGAGLKSTWKRLKGKKKKQSNLTAPETNLPSLESDHSPSSSPSRKRNSLGPLKENEGESGEGKGKGLFGKWSASKDKQHTITKQDSVSQETASNSPSYTSPGSSSRRKSPMGSGEDFHRPESRSSMEDNLLSQKSDMRSSDEYLDGDKTSRHMNSSKIDLVLSLPTDYSQTSAKLSRSQSENFVTHKDHLSTQSSFVTHKDHLSTQSSFVTHKDHLSTQSSTDANVQVMPLEDEHDPSLSGEQNLMDRGFLPNGHLVLSEEQQHELMERDFTKGCPSIYAEYGDKQHKMNLRGVQELLESSGEMEPVDLGVIQEWDGWVMATRDIV